MHSGGLTFSKPTLIKVDKCFSPPSSLPPTRSSGKERLIGQKRMWTCWEIVLWKQSNLYWQAIRSSAHTDQQWYLNSLANTIHESTMTFQSIRSFENLPISPDYVSSRKLLQYHKKFFGLFLFSHNKQWWEKARRTNARASSAKTSVSKAHWRAAKSGKVNQCHSIVHCLLGYTYTVSSSACSSITRKPLFQVPSRKHHMAVFSKTSSHKTVSSKTSHVPT